MKVIANLGKIGNERTALIIDNKHFPYYIVNGYNGETEGNNLWAWTVAYYDNVIDFAKGITYYSNSIGWHRLDEIASKAIDYIIENNPYEAEEFLKEDLELDWDEVEYFCVTEKLDEEKEMYDDED